MTYSPQTLRRIDYLLKRILKNCSTCTNIYLDKVFCSYYITYNGQVINCVIEEEISQVHGRLLPCAKALRIVTKITQKQIESYTQNNTSLNIVENDMKKKIPTLAKVYFGLECLK